MNIPIEEGTVDVHARRPVRRRIDIVLEADHRCPEGVIADVGSQVDVVIHCERNGGHDGNHTATTERGTAEWPRIEHKPRLWPDDQPPF